MVESYQFVTATASMRRRPSKNTLFFAVMALGLLGFSTYLKLYLDLANANAGEESWLGATAWTASQLEELTLEQKVSQMFAARAYGHFTSSDDPAYQRLLDLVDRFQIGGLVFFQGDPLSQATLSNELQAHAEVPLLFSQDMEWGTGMRLEHTTTFPQAMAIGATRNPDYAYAAGYVTAREARALGTDQVYAPVADVNNNPDNPIINVRSFGERPELVSEMVTAFVQGLQAGGVIATVKHFPGHGDTDMDSHADLPVLPFDLARLDSIELQPFRTAIDKGAMSVMVGHLALPKIGVEKMLPATLSPRVTRSLLRERLGFRGLVVTDALDMKGITEHYDAGAAAVRAIEAGADVLLLSTDVYAARAAVLQAIEDGRLTESRIDASVRRILRAKEWLGLPVQPFVNVDGIRDEIGTIPHRALSETIARAAITLLRNSDDLLPLRTAPQRVLAVTLAEEEDDITAEALHRVLREQGVSELTTRRLDGHSDPADFDAVVREASGYDLLVVPSFLSVHPRLDGDQSPDQNHRLLDRLSATGRPVVLISFGNPYVVMGTRQPAVYIAAYGPGEGTQRAVGEALFGASGFTGRLPITIPGLYAYNEGIQTEALLPRMGYPEEAGMNSRVLMREDSLILQGITDQAFPGAAVAIGRGKTIVKMRGYGHFTYTSPQPVAPGSVFDLASLTKVVATTTAAMQLYETGKLDLDEPVVAYLPAFGQHGKSKVTVRQLLTHTSGLAPFRPFYQLGLKSRNEIIKAIMAETPEYEPGTESRYSDLGVITLGLIIEAITGQDLATYADEAIFKPLGMNHTGFRPIGVVRDTTIVPTEHDTYYRNRLMQGEVHDETAYAMGGTAGHAGLFSTAEDLARFATMLVEKGTYDGKQFLKPETLRLFTTPVDPEHHTRALGWDTKSPEDGTSAGKYFGPHSFGHTGFTGTSIWIDPDQKLYAILLTNRVYPSRKNQRHKPVRAQFADLAYLSLSDVPLLPLMSTHGTHDRAR